MEFSELLMTGDNEVISIVGSGGKTSLINLVAQSCSQKKVLVSTTTKMFMPEGMKVVFTRKACLEHHAQMGVQCLGILNKETNKLESLSRSDLASVLKGYKLTFLEADGSKMKPLKGWKLSEPIIHDATTQTWGVLSIKSLNKMINDENVHNLTEFLALTRSRENTLVTKADLVAVVCAKNGLFKGSKGSKVLVINQVENVQEKKDALEIMARIQLKIKIDRYLIGSVLKNEWAVIGEDL